MGQDALLRIVMTLPGIIIGFAFHEFAHAITASWFGDDTAKRLGRVTLNPLSHLDPIGTLLLLFGTIGWAKPVPVDVERLRPRIVGDIVVSLAGIIMNFLLAVLFFILANLAGAGLLGWQEPALVQVLASVAWINTVMVGFNLLPIPPLDGFRVIRYAFPAGSNELIQILYRYGPILLMILVFSRVLDLQPFYLRILDLVRAVAGPIVRLFV